MIERVVRNDEVVGLIPICSTILRPVGFGWHAILIKREAPRAESPSRRRMVPSEASA